MTTTLREKAATLLDLTHDAAARKLGIHTDSVREHLAAWLDGALTLKAAAVRRRIRYLETIAR